MLEYKYDISLQYVGNIYVFRPHKTPTMYLQLIYIYGSPLTTTLKLCAWQSVNF
jgi:hypothetical protein